MRRTLLLVLLACALAATPAFGATRAGYEPVTGAGSPPSAGPPTGGTLPFTGFDLVPVAIVGAALLTLGLTLHHTARR